MDRDHTRRRFLQVAGAGSGVALAGCVGGDAGGGQRSVATPTRTPPPTDAPSETTTVPEPTTEPPAKDMSTVFHFSKGPSAQKHAVANVKNLLSDDTVDLGEVVLVANGLGIELLVAAESKFPDEVATLQERGARFRACHNSMEAFSVDASELLPGVEVVPSGVGELTRLQASEGFAYIETP